MDFKALKSVKAAPPAGTGPASSGDSPLQGEVKDAYKDGDWHSFQGIGTEVVGTRKSRDGKRTSQVREFMTVTEELKRAARQLGYGINIRVDFQPGGKLADVYFRVGEKRKYEKRTTGSATDNGSGSDSE